MSRAIVLLAALSWAVAAAEVRLGKALTLSESTPLETLLKEPAAFNGKTVQVKGKVTAVCERMGCWMNLVDDGNRSVRIKVDDGEIAFPKSSIGKTAIAEGRFQKIELNREQALARARHEAEEQGRTFDPASVKSGTIIYQILGSGAVILE
jgi:hypothetical protein